MPKPGPEDEAYRGATRLFAALITAFGLLIVLLTLARGQGLGAATLWIGLLFTGLGAARLLLSRWR
jgi:hypothetical protein